MTTLLTFCADGFGTGREWPKQLPKPNYFLCKFYNRSVFSHTSIEFQLLYLCDFISKPFTLISGIYPSSRTHHNSGLLQYQPPYDSNAHQGQVPPHRSLKLTAAPRFTPTTPFMLSGAHIQSNGLLPSNGGEDMMIGDASSYSTFEQNPSGW